MSSSPALAVGCRGEEILKSLSLAGFEAQVNYHTKLSSRIMYIHTLCILALTRRSFNDITSWYCRCVLMHCHIMHMCTYVYVCKCTVCMYIHACNMQVFICSCVYCIYSVYVCMYVHVVCKSLYVYVCTVHTVYMYICTGLGMTLSICTCVY